jgi:NTE family protein
VNCSPLDRNYKYKDSILDIAIRTYSLMSRSNILPDMNLCDYVVVPDSISNTKTFDLGALDKNIELGYMAACKILNSIRRD